MSEIKLISNTPKSSHSQGLDKLISTANEVFIAVAFLKKSGLSNIISALKKAIDKGNKFTFIVGRHFALTEPAALWQLFHLFKGTKSNLYLAELKANAVFHPKMYLFKSESNCNIIIGSANLTNGGLVNNYECSLSYTCKDVDDIWEQCYLHFTNELLVNANVAKRSTILLYESFYNQQKKVRKETRAVPDFKGSELEFDYDRLRKHLEKFNRGKREISNREKASNYSKAQKVLNKIADTESLTKDKFKGLLDELTGGDPNHYAYWHSGGLSRGKNGKEGKSGIYDAWRQFSKLVRFIKENKEESPSFVFEHGKVLLSKINFAGINYLTEIMMTYNSSKFANMNNNPIKVLKKQAGLNIKTTPYAYDGADYQEYCLLITEMCDELGLKNMLEADSFFNSIYWELKKKGIIK